MKKNGTDPKLINELINALKLQDLKYLKVQQSFDANGGLKPLKIDNFIIDQSTVQKLIKTN